MAKIIGIVGKVFENSFGVTVPYLEYFEQFGTPVVISPHSPEEIDKLINFIDLFVLPGGADVDPKRYNQKPKFRTNKPDLYLEWFDAQILPELINRHAPIFGICRGLQTLCVHYGGTLFQDLWYHKYSKDRSELIHWVDVEGFGAFKVNSLHHQGIKFLPEGLIATGIAREDKIIESISNYEGNVKAVQWHPEEIGDEYSLNLITELLS